MSVKALDELVADGCEETEEGVEEVANGTLLMASKGVRGASDVASSTQRRCQRSLR